MIVTERNPIDLFNDKYEEPSNHVAVLLGASIMTLDMRPRLLYPLADVGVRTVAELLDVYQSGLRNIRNIGVSAEWEIELILIRADLLHIKPT